MEEILLNKNSCKKCYYDDFCQGYDFCGNYSFVGDSQDDFGIDELIEHRREEFYADFFKYIEQYDY